MRTRERNRNASRTHLSVARQPEEPQPERENASDRHGNRPFGLDPQHRADDADQSPEPLGSSTHPPQPVPVPLKLSLLALPSFPLNSTLSSVLDGSVDGSLLLNDSGDDGRDGVARGREGGVEVGEVGLRRGGLSWEKMEGRVDLGRCSVMLRDGKVAESEGEEGGLKRSERGRVKDDEGGEKGEDRPLREEEEEFRASKTSRNERKTAHKRLSPSGPGDETEGELLEVRDRRLAVERRKAGRGEEDGREEADEGSLERRSERFLR